MQGLGESAKAVENEVARYFNELNKRRLERITGIFEIVKNQTKYKAYDSIAVNKFKLDYSENQLRH